MLRTSTLLCTCLLLACDRDVAEPPANAREEERTVAPDNSKVNERDRHDQAPTPLDQGNNSEDLRVTKEIREAIVDRDGLSFTAQNVKVITEAGRVTLRGPVETTAERDAIVGIATSVVGAERVENLLEVTANNERRNP